MMKRYKVKVADTEREYVAESLAEAQKQFTADFGDMSGRVIICVIIWTEPNFYRASAGSDALYYTAHKLDDAKDAFKAVYGETPPDAVKWDTINESDIPAGVEVLPAFPL